MAANPPYPDLVTTAVETLPTGHLVLRHSVIVNAAVEQVWDAFTTSEGLRSFVAPVASMDLRIGGRWESSYDPQARIGDPGNIVNEVLSFLPLQMLSIRIAQTPPGFPDVALAKRLWTVTQLEPAGERRVRVTTTMLGWEGVEQSHPVFQLFYSGNALTLGRLYERFEHGPRKWE